MKHVFLLWHTRQLPAEKEDTKLIGVYDSRDAANRARERASGSPGFSSHPTGFEVDDYEIGKDHWVDGFVAVTDRKK